MQCSKEVRKNQKAIFCDSCKNWVHAKCNGTSDREYEDLVQENDDVLWNSCIPCVILRHADMFPYGS